MHKKINMMFKILKLIFKKDGTAQAIAMHRLIETLAKDDKRIIKDEFAFPNYTNKKY